MESTQETVVASKAEQSDSGDGNRGQPRDLPVEITVNHGFGVYCNETKFGPTGYIRDNVGFVAEAKVLHPLGKKAALFQMDKHQMEFFELNPNVDDILGMAVAPNRKRIAFCEKARPIEGKAPFGQVSVYHVQGSHLRTLTFPNMTGEFISCCFTKDTKFLVALGSAPEHTVVYWKWSNMKLIAHTKTSVLASRIRVNPADASIITTSGKDHLKLWRLEKDLSLKANALLPGKTETKTHFVDHAWMRTRGLLLALTVEGSCFVFEVDGTQCELVQSLKIQHSSEALHRFETIETYKKGFVVGGSGTDLGGYMCVYEHTDDRKEPFMLIKYFYSDEPHLTISNLAISPMDETVAMFVQPVNQVMTFPLVNIDTLENDQSVFKYLRKGGYHTGRVLDIDIALNKPCVVTCGADKQIKVWDIESHRASNQSSTWDCRVSHHNEHEEPHCVAFHPAGLHVLVGYKDNIQYFNVLSDCLEPARSTPLNVKNCKSIRFSPGGHLFAVSFGISLEVYNTYSFTLVKTLMGHIRRVRSLSWFDNILLYSTGEDGSVYGWNINTGKRVDETTIQNCVFTGLASDHERPIVCAAGNDKRLYEVRRNDQGDTEFATCSILGEDLITELVITHQNNAVIAGTATGCLRVYPWPLGKHADPTNFQEIKVHNGPVNNLVLTHDDYYCLSVADDGTVFATAITSASSFRSKTDGMDPTHFNYNAVMVDREKIDIKDRIIVDLRKEVEELKSRHELEMAMQSKVWHDQLKQKTEEMDTAIAVERDRFEALNQRHEAYSREHMEEVDKREANHITSMQAMENEYEHRLAVEISRYDEVSEALERQQQGIGEEIERLKVNHMERLEKLEQQRVKEINEMQQQIELLNEELTKNEVEYKTILSQQTEDDDQEILVLQKKREKDKDAFHDMVSKMTAKLNIQTNRCEKLQTKMEEVQEIAAERDEEYNQLKTAYHNLQDTVKQYERQLNERDVSLQQKERAILGLRSKHSTLENFKYVLNHRIQMLSKEKGPVAEHIDALEKHIRDMYEELVNEFHEKKMTTRALGDSKMKMTGLQNDIKGLTATLRNREREIMAFNHQLTTIINYVDPKDYAASMNDLYRTFVKKEKVKPRVKAADGNVDSKSKESASKDDEVNEDSVSSGTGGGGGGGGGGDQAAVFEANRQRDYMEKTVHTLKKTLKLAGKKMQRKSKISMEENSLLISECNSLRRENLLQKRKIEELKSELNMAMGEKMRDSRSALDSVHWRDATDESQPPVYDPRENSAWTGSGSVGAFGLGPEPLISPMNVGASPLPARNASTALAPASMLEPRSGVKSRHSLTAPKLQAKSRPSTHGQLIRGSTRPLMESANAKTQVSSMLGQLEDNNREMEIQRMEIKRLRDQVHALVQHIERQNMNESPTHPSPSGSDGENDGNLPSLSGKRGGYSRIAAKEVPPALVVRSHSTPGLRD